MNAHKIRMMILLPCAGIIALVAAACSENTEQQSQKGPELVFSVKPATRATINYPIEDYFAIYDQVGVLADGYISIYKYNDGLLEYFAMDILSFPAYNQPLVSVTLDWRYTPNNRLDQTTKEKFLKNDPLQCRLTNLMPSTLVPVEFSHTNYKMTFTAGGENEGEKIASLSIIYGEEEIYYAYCGGETNDAQLMLWPGTNLSGKSGLVTFEGEETPQEFVMPEYTIPQGSNQNITVTIIL